MKTSTNPVFLQEHDSGVILCIRVSPKSSRSQIAGVIGDELKVSLNAPPVDGKANKELVKLLAKTFSIPKNCVEILSGESSRSKRILLHGVQPDAIRSQITFS
ncbi:MAG: YggU family protein [Candidatus Omnitrophica bacterium]|nr:YggU family protein [Candidatus Omnitrophota bacterium]